MGPNQRRDPHHEISMVECSCYHGLVSNRASEEDKAKRGATVHGHPSGLLVQKTDYSWVSLTNGLLPTEVGETSVRDIHGYCV